MPGTVRRLADGTGIERGYVVSIPKQIADRYDIEKGDEVWWTDNGEGGGPEFIPPEML